MYGRKTKSNGQNSVERRQQKEQIELNQKEKFHQRQRQLQKKVPMSDIIAVPVKEAPNVSMKEPSVEMNTTTPEDESACHAQL